MTKLMMMGAAESSGVYIDVVVKPVTLVKGEKIKRF